MTEPRPRDASATRAAILEAARTLFAERGFDGVGLREIAARAGINVALTSRYFGSKEDLFKSAITEGFVFAEIANVKRQDFGRHLANYILSKRERGALEPLLALLRSTGNPQIAALTREIMDADFIAPLAEWLGGERAKLRATMIAAVILGVSTSQDVLEVAAYTKATRKALVDVLAPAIQLWVDGS
jgi:AcrR family transcriptional regulator